MTDTTTTKAETEAKTKTKKKRPQTKKLIEARLENEVLRALGSLESALLRSGLNYGMTSHYLRNLNDSLKAAIQGRQLGRDILK